MAGAEWHDALEHKVSQPLALMTFWTRKFFAMGELS